MLRFFDESKDTASMLFSPALAPEAPSMMEFKFDFSAAVSSTSMISESKDNLSIPVVKNTQEQKPISVSSLTILSLMKETSQKAPRNAQRKKQAQQAKRIPYARPKPVDVLELDSAATSMQPPSLTNVFLFGQPAAGDPVLIPSPKIAFEPWR